MRRNAPITEEEKQAIAAALEKKPNASLIARKTGRSFATVWRVAEWAGIELTAGREAKGYKRLSAARRRKITAVLRANPKALQREIAQQTGVSRVTVSRIEGGVRRPRRFGATSRITELLENHQRALIASQTAAPKTAPMTPNHTARCRSGREV